MAEGAEEPLALALAALGRKERTVAELAAWLNERGVGAEEVEAVIEQLAGAGVLDDARFAHRYAEDKRELSGWGSERMNSCSLALLISCRVPKPPGIRKASIAGRSLKP